MEEDCLQLEEGDLNVSQGVDVLKQAVALHREGCGQYH